MSDQSEYKPPQSQGGEYDQSQGGQYNKEKQPYEPPPPKPCPDPCADEDRPGPPKIRPECCPPHDCCDDAQHCCTWDEVEDPCVRAASADCKKPWGKIECKCESSNEECCKEWDCGGYPQGTCVPCKPCEGLITDPTDPTQPTGPVTDDCTSENLGNQLEALNRSISSQQGEKAKLEAEIKAKGERATALTELIKSFDDIVKKYKEQRFKLTCKEDCLKGFYRDVKDIFDAKYKDQVTDLTSAINSELCKDELAKCCQKNLEGKLTKVTRLIWEQQEAETKMKKADQAFAIIKDLPKWTEDRFKELETLRDEIDKALNDVDPQKHKWAFYLFYWKFVPKLCKCFPFPFCCVDKPAGETEEQNQQQTQQSQNKQNQDQQKPLAHLGCKPGDWHPSAIDEDLLKALICCAWEYARTRKEEYLKASDSVASATNNLDFIKKKVEADAKTLEDRIKSGLDKVTKPTPTSA